MAKRRFFSPTRSLVIVWLCLAAPACGKKAAEPVAASDPASTPAVEVAAPESPAQTSAVKPTAATESVELDASDEQAKPSHLPAVPSAAAQAAAAQPPARAAELAAEPSTPEPGQPEKPAEPAAAEAASQSRPASDPHEFEKLSTQELLTAISKFQNELRNLQTGAAVAAAGDEPAVQAIQLVERTVQAANTLFGHAEATDEERAAARRAKLHVLITGVELAPGEFAERFDDFADTLFVDDPQHEVTISAVAYRLVKRSLSSTPPSSSALAELTEFARTYPESELGIEMFGVYGHQLEAAGQWQNAAAGYQRGIELYTGQQNVQGLQNHLQRVQRVLTALLQEAALAPPGA